MRRRLDPARARGAVVHLVGCEDCRCRVAEAVGVLPPADPGARERAFDAAYDRAAAVALGRARTVLDPRAQERFRASARRVARGGRPTELSQPSIRALIEHAVSFRHSSPAEALELTFLATVYARRPELDREGAVANDLRALAYAEHANALRIHDRLAQAAAALADAGAFAGKGTGDVLLEARLRDVAATLHAARREFETADRLLVRVARIYRKTGDLHLAGRALIKRGIYAGYRNDAEEALRLLREGLALIDPARDPVVLLAARHGEIWWTAELGRCREARRLLFKARGLYAADGSETNAIRLRWLEGKIAAGLGDLARAEERLAGVCRDFDRLGLPYKKALAELELATVLLRRGEWRRVYELIEEMVATFERLAIRREALGAVVILHEAARSGVLSIAVVQQIAGVLRRLEHLPAPEPAGGGT